MHTTNILYRRSRKGTSTVLGTLIFVGIMFTAVIPMLLVMNQANTLHEMRKVEVGRLDEEKDSEEINFYAYPLEDDPLDPDPDHDEIDLRIRNQGSVPVKIVSVWINDVKYPQDVNINSMDTISLDPLTVDQGLASYTVKVITENGNIFTSISGTLYYSGGIWYTPSLGISVHIINIKGKYEINVTKGTDPVETVGYYESQFTEWGEVINTFRVDDPDFYDVTIKKLVGNDLIELFDSPLEVKIDWPPEDPDDGPILHIYVDGNTLKTI